MSSGGVLYAQDRELPLPERPPKVDWPFGGFVCCPGCSESLGRRSRCRSSVNLATLTLAELVDADACILDRADELARRRLAGSLTPVTPRPQRRRWWRRKKGPHHGRD